MPNHQTLNDHALATALKSELGHIPTIENRTRLAHKTLMVLGANRLPDMNTLTDHKDRPSRIGIDRRLDRTAR